MAVVLVGVTVRHERRIRALFSAPLAASAFDPVCFSVASDDGLAQPIAVSGALIVASNPACIELALGADLNDGARYALVCTAVPALDGSTYSGSSAFLVGQAVGASAPSVAVGDHEALLYGLDLVFDGADFVEAASGDLAVLAGEANARAALTRRLTGAPLPHDDTYSARIRAFVDAPGAAASALRSSLLDQAKQDDRVRDVRVVLAVDPSDPASARFEVEAGLVGGPRVAVPVPLGRA